MNHALITIAKSITDVLGVVGAESLLMRSIIRKYWDKDALEMAERVIAACINEKTGEVRPEAADGILAQYRLKLGDDFIEKVVPEMAIVVNAAYDKGRAYLVDRMMEGAFVSQKRISDDVLSNLAYITGSKKTSIYSTLSKWFRESQGKYFDRFIIPETARLMSYADNNEGNIATMRAIGKRYREFVQADGYWSAVSEYNTETAKVFSQVQLMQEMNITTYRIEAVLDEKTCSPCEWLNGTEWEVSQAVERMNEMLISEEENVRDVNPFPTRQDPKEIEDPQESNYFLPPYHPRCRCNIVTTSSVTLAPQSIPSSGGVPIKPTDKSLSNVFTTHVAAADGSTVSRLMDDINALTGASTGDVLRQLKKAEYGRMKDAFNTIPYQLRKWAIGNKKGYYAVAISEKSNIPSRVMGNVIQINEKFLRKGVDPAVIQHELRHALINKQIIDSRKGARGAESLWDSITTGHKTQFPVPIHVNNMYRLNGGRGALAAEAAVDEFLAMIGDYYKPGISFDELVKRIRKIEVEDVIGSLATDFSKAKKWTAAEAKRAAALWWDWSDIDNLTLMSKRQILAKLAHKPSTAAVQRVAFENELRLREMLKASGISKAQQLGDNEPFDVWIGGDAIAFYRGPGYKKYMPKHAIEIKTIVRAKNDKITMHKPSLARKRAELERFGGKTQQHTVVFDERTGKIYYRNELGSFRLSSMQEVTEDELVRIFGGKSKIVEAPAALDKVPIFDASKIKKKTKLTSDEGAGINGSYIIKAKTGPKGKYEQYLYKPIDEEKFLLIETMDEVQDGMSPRSFVSWVGGTEDLMESYGFEPDQAIIESIGARASAGNLAKREALAYNIFKEFKDRGQMANLAMPETFLVYEGEEVVGVAVKWIDDLSEFHDIYSRQIPRLLENVWDIVDMNDAYDMAVFDYIIGNTDRHFGNLLVNQSSGQLVLIDHGYSFPSAKLAGRADGLSEFRNMLLNGGAFSGLDDAVGKWDIEDWIDVLEEVQWEKLAKDFKLNKSETSALLLRVEDMKKIIYNDKMEDWFMDYAASSNAFHRGGFDRDLIDGLTYPKKE